MIHIAILGKKLAQYAAVALMIAALSGCRDDKHEGDTSQLVDPPDQSEQPAPAPTNSAPRISGSPATSVEASQSYSFQPAASDPDKDTLAFTIRNKPAWASFNTTTGRLSGTPDDGDAGTFSNIVITVSDGIATASLDPFSIAVSAGQDGAEDGAENSAPKISGTPATSVTAGAAYSFKPQGTDADNDELTYSVQNLPGWAKFSTASGQVSGTPAAADVGTYSNIVISVSDGSAKASLPAFAITVKASANGTATLSWTPPTENTDGSALTDLAGFRIRYGASESDLDQVVELDNPGLATYVVTDLHSGTWYFAVKAYSESGAESELSNVASKTIP